MNAPTLWIIIPLLVAVIALFVRNQRILTYLGVGVSLILAVIALFVPIDQAFQVGNVSVKISPVVDIFGRTLTLKTADGSLLVIFYGLVSMWIFGAEVTQTARRFVPLGMIIVVFMVASLAVEPFLFAAIFIELAVLVAIPLLLPPGQKQGPGILRFLIYQTLSMPFILFSGWLLAGVEASPSDLSLVLQSATILGIGFALLLSIFPFHTWLPMLAEEVSPYLIGFLLWILPTITIIFGMGFLDRYAWLRTAEQFQQGMRLAGLLMVVLGGVWSAFERHLCRQMAYAVIAETGFSLLALSLAPGKAVQIVFLLMIPRSLALLVWSMSLDGLRQHTTSLRFGAVQGLARLYPLASAGVVLAHLSVAGLPLLAGFPPRLALWEGLGAESIPVAFWFLLGTFGLMTGALRTLAVLVMSKEGNDWEVHAITERRVMIGIGIASLLILGVFPQVLQPLLVNLPTMFEHFGK